MNYSNPYQPAPITTSSLDDSPTVRRSYSFLILFTSVQILVVLSAHRVWMESPANQYVLFGQSWMEKVLSSIFYSLVFVFLNCTLASTANRRRFAIESGVAMESGARMPVSLAKNCERLTYILAAFFAVSGISMSAYHGFVHPVTPFMVISGALTVLSAMRFRLEMKRIEKAVASS
ncbi:MAG: hypothetical protein MUC83_14670 [Pirellula sp.]|nr:hypothetical protein [Pirellula sp.]